MAKGCCPVISLALIFSVHSCLQVRAQLQDSCSIRDGPPSSGGDDGCSQMALPDLDPALNDLDQEDPALAEVLRKRYLVRPKGYGSVNTTTIEGWRLKTLTAQYGQPIAIEALFQRHWKYLEQNKGGKVDRTGFFLEAGAFDGIFLSNSLNLELKYNWTGLLVEPLQETFHFMATRNRNAALLPSCLSTQKRPQIVKFEAYGLLSGILPEGGNGPFPVGGRRVQCFPLYSIIQALGNPRIDYMSLDIEGAEFPVLQTIPWSKVDISVLQIEVNHLGEAFPGSLRDLRQLLKDNGYFMYQRVSIDEIYVKRDFLNQLAEEP